MDESESRIFYIIENKMNQIDEEISILKNTFGLYRMCRESLLNRVPLMIINKEMQRTLTQLRQFLNDLEIHEQRWDELQEIIDDGESN